MFFLCGLVFSDLKIMKSSFTPASSGKLTDKKSNLESKEIKDDSLSWAEISDEEEKKIPHVSVTLKSIMMDPRQLSGVSTEVLKTFRGLMFGQNRVYKFVLGNLETIAVDSSGNVGGSSGGTIPMVNFINAAEWSSLAALFDEVYLQSAELVWLPYNLYRANAPASNRSNCGLAWIAHHHNASTYTSFTSALVNPTLKLTMTNALKFKYKWNNIERVKKDSIDIVKSGTATPTQGWCPTNATSIAVYQGYVQYLGAATITDWTSLNLGNVAVRYKLWFRNRA